MTYGDLLKQLSGYQHIDFRDDVDREAGRLNTIEATLHDLLEKLRDQYDAQDDPAAKHKAPNS